MGPRLSSPGLLRSLPSLLLWPGLSRRLCGPQTVDSLQLGGEPVFREPLPHLITELGKVPLTSVLKAAS